MTTIAGTLAFLNRTTLLRNVLYNVIKKRFVASFYRQKKNSCYIHIYPMIKKIQPIKSQESRCILCGMQRVICNA